MFYYSCNFVTYCRLDCKSADHPACSMGDFFRRLLHQPEPGEQFPCFITTQRSVTITIWCLLMIFTVTLMVSFVETGNHLYFARRSFLSWNETDRVGSFSVYSFPLLLFYWWKDRILFPPSCPVVMENADHSLWMLLKIMEILGEHGVKFGAPAPLWCLSGVTEWKE